MKRHSTLVHLLIILLLGMGGCGKDDEIAATFDGDEKLEEGSQTPLMLTQNYPNPFNPVTTFKVYVAKEMHLSIRVYGEEWQETSKLLNRTLRPGIYSISFDAKDLPSGVYYYVAEGDGHKQIRAMRLMK
ncbi:MAG: T9SS type A sorting domain-containing protein [Ignavibacteriales bacterium]|nr:T9SS type A sorting domain-containing protein [Ignavibacteriales bacterium]